jgi:hypothetical protein
MFNKKKILVKDGIKTPGHQQIFNNVIGYEDIKLLLYRMITSKNTNSVLLTGPRRRRIGTSIFDCENILRCIVEESRKL